MQQTRRARTPKEENQEVKPPENQEVKQSLPTKEPKETPKEEKPKVMVNPLTGKKIEWPAEKKIAPKVPWTLTEEKKAYYDERCLTVIRYEDWAAPKPITQNIEDRNKIWQPPIQRQVLSEQNFINAFAGNYGYKGAFVNVSTVYRILDIWKNITEKHIMIAFEQHIISLGLDPRQRMEYIERLLADHKKLRICGGNQIVTEIVYCPGWDPETSEFPTECLPESANDYFNAEYFQRVFSN